MTSDLLTSREQQHTVWIRQVLNTHTHIHTPDEIKFILMMV